MGASGYTLPPASLNVLPPHLQARLCSSCPNPLCGLSACVRMMNWAGNVILEGCHEDAQASGLRQKAKVGPYIRTECEKSPAPVPAGLDGNSNSGEMLS